MATSGREHGTRVTASLLDRLLDLQPREPYDPPDAARETIEAFRESVQRDLENLLNTKNPYHDLPAEFVEAGHSVLSYGLRDLGHRRAGRYLDRGVGDDTAGAVRLRLGFNRYQQRTGAMRQHGVQQRHTHLQPTVSLNDCRGLVRPEIEIDEHARRAAAFHDLEHAQQRVFLRDERLAGVLPAVAEDFREARVLEIFGHDHIAEAEKAAGEARPFPVSLVHQLGPTP